MALDPHDLTLGDCFAAGHVIYLSCGACRVGRHLDYALTGKWADRKLLDLAREGRFVCTRCGAPAGFISVSAHLVRDPILSWTLPAQSGVAKG